MAQPRAVALGQARQLRTELHQTLPELVPYDPNLHQQIYNAQRNSTNRIAEIVQNRRGDVWPVLRNVVFTDINTLDECVMALNDWNTLLRETFETLHDAQMRLNLVVHKQFTAYFAMLEFINELHKIITRCILRVGQLSPTAQ